MILVFATPDARLAGGWTLTKSDPSPAIGDPLANRWFARALVELVPSLKQLAKNPGALHAPPGTAPPPTARQIHRAAETIGRLAECLRQAGMAPSARAAARRRPATTG